MEFFQELALTTLLSLLITFLFAKLVSIASYSSSSSSSSSSSAALDSLSPGDSVENVVSNVDIGENGAESLKDHVNAGESVERGLETVNMRVFGGESVKVSGLDLESVKGRTELVEIGFSDGILVKEVPETAEFQGSDLIRVKEVPETVSVSIPIKEVLEIVDEFPVLDESYEMEKGLDDVGRSDGELEQVVKFGVLEVEEVEKCGAEFELEEKHEGERCDQMENVTSSKEGDDDEDDDWEGIERSETEKLFALAVAFVDTGGGELLSKIGSDLQMKLYGLHKIATEGPCYELHPSALKISARAKWHAWRQLGSMNPEVAMEQYINLLSTLVPGWMGEESSGDGKGGGKGGGGSNSPESGIYGKEAPGSSSFVSQSLALQNDRKLEDINACTKESDAIGVQELLEQGASVDSLGHARIEPTSGYCLQP